MREVMQGEQPLDKETLRMMIKKNTLPGNLQEVFMEAKSWWYHNAKEVIQDNRLINDVREGVV